MPSSPPSIPELVETALGADDPLAQLEKAERLAQTTRDRQLVAIAIAHVREDRELVDALAREHLVDHPDSVLVARIAAASKCTNDTKEKP
jgi:hypothetical protein